MYKLSDSVGANIHDWTVNRNRRCGYTGEFVWDLLPGHGIGVDT